MKLLRKQLLDGGVEYFDEQSTGALFEKVDPEVVLGGYLDGAGRTNPGIFTVGRHGSRDIDRRGELFDLSCQCTDGPTNPAGITDSTSNQLPAGYHGEWIRNVRMAALKRLRRRSLTTQVCLADFFTGQLQEMKVLAGGCTARFQEYFVCHQIRLRLCSVCNAPFFCTGHNQFASKLRLRS